MFLRELRKIARPHWFDILFTVKQSSGISVTKLAKKMKMSYMGVKQHCEDLEKLGYLVTRRQPREKGSGGGRPEKRYRLTERAGIFFPSFDNEFTTDLLVSLREAYGANAPEKLIFTYLAHKTTAYRDQIEGDTLFDRASSFAKIRNREGHVCLCQEADDHVEVLEYHHPLAAIFEKHPATLRMERNLWEQVLNCSVRHREEEISGLKQTRIQLYPK